jgi:hypothetical protein
LPKLRVPVLPVSVCITEGARVQGGGVRFCRFGVRYSCEDHAHFPPLMFESRERVKEDIATLLEAIRLTGGGRYACLIDVTGAILFETPEPEGNEITTLRRLLDLHAKAIFALPAAMEAEGVGPASDPFEGWEHDELLLVFLNGRVGLVLAAPEADVARDKIDAPLRVMVDRLLRYDAAYRLNSEGSGLFFGRPKLEFVTIARAD